MRWLIVFVLIGYQLGAQDASIAKVIAVEGAVQATGRANTGRSLEKNSPIYLFDVITTSDESKVQIQFTDGGLLNLIPNSMYRVNEYQYRKYYHEDRFSSELIQGGFRSLSGSIAKKNPDGYTIKTPTSTIGIRGTIVEARIVEGSVYYAVEKGLATVSNTAGSATIGLGAPAQYAMISSISSPPEILYTRPSQLEGSIFLPPTGSIPIEVSLTPKASALSSQPATATISPGC